MPQSDQPVSLLSRVDRTSEWMRGSGPYANVALTCRVRLARNMSGHRFAHRCTPQELQGIWHRVRGTVSQSRAFEGFEEVGLEDLTELERFALVDRYLSSREHVQHPAGRGLLFHRSGSISVMVNEEDHFRIQSLYSGLQLEMAYKVCAEVQDTLEHGLGFAYSEQWGYLTACPTNVGTGLRASAMMHLPGLTQSQRLQQVLRAATNAGLAVRGLHGEGTDTHGCLHQFSNQVTLGKSEEELIAELEDSCKQIASAELEARRTIRRESPVLLEDRVARAYATLSYARSIDSEEALDCLSWLRWGCEEELLQGLDRQAVNELMIWIRPGVQQMLQTRRLPAEERDLLRANLLRQRLQQVKLCDKLTD